MEPEITRRKVADKTRSKIIAAAQKLFAKSGFSATSTQAIAHAAKVNETLIFHHFGNKAKLWQHVKATIVNATLTLPLAQQPTSLRIFLQQVIQQRLSVYQKNPDLIRLLQWQRLETKRDQLIAGNILAPTHWLAPIQHLQQIKEIRADITPDFVMIWLAASINAVIFDDIHFFNTEAQRKSYIEFITQGLEHALCEA